MPRSSRSPESSPSTPSGGDLVLTLEGRAPVRSPSDAVIADSIRALTPNGGPAFAILERADGDYVQCAGGDGVLTAEWREHAAGAFQHWVAGRNGRAIEPMVAVATNGAEVTVRSSERLAADDVVRIFHAFVRDRARPVEFDWRDVTARFSADATADATASVDDPDMRKPALVTDAFRARLAALLVPMGFAPRAKGAAFVRKRGKNTHRIDLSSSHYNGPGHVQCRVRLSFQDGLVRKRMDRWFAGGSLDGQTFGKAPSNIARRVEADTLFSALTATLPFFDMMESPTVVLTEACSRYVPGIERPVSVVPYLATHLGADAVRTYAKALLDARPELWPSFLGARGQVQDAQDNVFWTEHGVALAMMMASAGVDEAFVPPPSVVTSHGSPATHRRDLLGLMLRAFGEPEAAAALCRVDDARVITLCEERDRLADQTVDSVEAAMLALHAATGEQRRPRRSAPQPRLFQNHALHAPFGTEAQGGRT